MQEVKDFGKNVFKLIHEEQPEPIIEPMKTSGLSIGINITNITDTTTENYTLSIDKSGQAMITSPGYQGFLRGFSTLVQCLVFIDNNNTYQLQNLPIEIEDYPGFQQRGFFLDCVNSFVNQEELMEFIDAMMIHKLNTLVLILGGNAAIRVNISADGNKQPYETYTDTQLLELDQYAKTRGVQIIPGTESQEKMQWASNLLGINTICTDSNNPQKGELDLSSDTTKEFMKKILNKFVELFDGQLVYIGGDMQNRSCQNNQQDVFEGRKLACSLLEEIDKTKKCLMFINADHEQQEQFNSSSNNNTIFLNAYASLSNPELSYQAIVMNLALDLSHGILPLLSNRHSPSTIPNWPLYSQKLSQNTGNCLGSFLPFSYASSGHLQENAWIRGTLWSQMMWNSEPKVQGAYKESLKRLVYMERRLGKWGIRNAPFTCEYCTLNFWDCF